MSGEWYREELDRAKARNDLIPPHARPTVYGSKMTAPDPTAGEREAAAMDALETLAELGYPVPCDPEGIPVLPEPTSPPAVAASTGTSEDVEALAKVILAERLAARELPNTYMDDAELVESMKPRARAVLASDWLAAREAAARAEGAAKALTDLADDIDSTGYGWTSVVDAERFKSRLRERAAREGRP